MEWRIGEIFEYNGEWYQCLKGISCEECDFSSNSITCDIHGAMTCTRKGRSDDTSVVFKKLEKVGRPFERNGYIYQEYKAHTYPLLINGGTIIPTDNGFAVMIKQNKEEIEEKNNAKLSNSESIGKNLKEFDINLAKQGKPVCTRDGRKARIVCFDRVTNSTNEYTGHLIVLVTNPNGDEQSFYYTEKGNLAGEDEYDNHKWDLMMLPEKKEGWMNIYSNGDNHRVGSPIHNSKEEALNNKESNAIDTVKIEWRE